MRARISPDISPCIAKDRRTGIGIPLVPDGILDFDVVGIDGKSFMEQHSWAFAGVIEDAPKRTKKVVEQATAAPGEER